MAASGEGDGFPMAAGILLGVGIGGFFDGVVFHQVLQWHHLVTSAGHPPALVVRADGTRLVVGTSGITPYVWVVRNP